MTTPVDDSTSGALRVEITGDGIVDVTTAAEIVSVTLFDIDAQAVGNEGDEHVPILVAGFATVAAAEAARETILARHRPLITAATVDSANAADWVVSQRAGLEPTAVGQWHIRAPWDPTPDDVAPIFDIVVDPGVAFGHGAHPTTRLAIELMTRQLDHGPAPDRVIDLGTGTGVAALIAARSNMTVVAVENDAGACEVAGRNIEHNSAYPFGETSARITLIHGDAADTEVDDCDLVVANVTLDVQRLIASTCAAADRIVISGILCSQVRAVQDLYPTHVASTIRTTGEWAGIEFSSRAPRCRKKRNE